MTCKDIIKTMAKLIIETHDGRALFDLGEIATIVGIHLWVYKQELQLKLEDFVFPYGKLNLENEWIKLAELLPWDRIEERYAAKFENNGHPAHSARMALGVLLIKSRLAHKAHVWNISRDKGGRFEETIAWLEDSKR